MSYSDDAARWAMHERFIQEIEVNGLSDKMHIVAGEASKDSDYDPIGFYSRYQQARTIVKDYIKKTQDVDLV